MTFLVILKEKHGNTCWLQRRGLLSIRGMFSTERTYPIMMMLKCRPDVEGKMKRRPRTFGVVLAVASRVVAGYKG